MIFVRKLLLLRNLFIGICTLSLELYITQLAYLKSVATDKIYRFKVIDSIFHKCIQPVSQQYISSETNFRIAVVLPHYHPVNDEVSSNLGRQNFRIIVSPINKIKVSDLK